MNLSPFLLPLACSCCAIARPSVQIYQLYHFLSTGRHLVKALLNAFPYMQHLVRLWMLFNAFLHWLSSSYPGSDTRCNWGQSNRGWLPNCSRWVWFVDFVHVPFRYKHLITVCSLSPTWCEQNLSHACRQFVQFITEHGIQSKQYNRVCNEVMVLCRVAIEKHSAWTLNSVSDPSRDGPPLSFSLEQVTPFLMQNLAWNSLSGPHAECMRPRLCHPTI